MASHRSAARLWGIPRRLTIPVEVIITRRTRTPELDGVIVHRPRDLQRPHARSCRADIPTTNVLRLLCDLGAVDPASVPAAVGHVVTCRLASPVALRSGHRPPLPGAAATVSRRSAAALEEWVIDGKPVDSVLETAMRRLFVRHRLPAVRVPSAHRRSRGRLPHRRHADRARVRWLGVPRQDAGSAGTRCRPRRSPHRARPHLRCASPTTKSSASTPNRPAISGRSSTAGRPNWARQARRSENLRAQSTE